jgi:hypothetical protein
MSKKGRHRRTPDQHRRRWEVGGSGVAIVVGGAVAAAFVSTGQASADDLLGPAAGDDAVTDVAQAVDPSAVTAAAVPADAATTPADPANDDAFTEFIQAIDGNAFTADGAANDLLGVISSQINDGLANTVFGPEINQIATQIVCADTPSCVDSLLITPLATGDDPFTTFDQYLAQDFSAFVVPTGDDNYLAILASYLDSQVDGTVFGPELYTIVEQVIAGLNTIAADPAAFVP